MKKTIKIICILSLSSLLISCSGKDGEAEYPNKNINVIVPYKAGGITDVGARTLMKVSKSEIGKKLIIENQVGSEGQLGYTKINRAKPDGYTIGFINLKNFISLSLTRETEFDKDTIKPIMNYMYDPGILVVKSDSKWTTIEDFINDAKNNPKKYSIGSNEIELTNMGIENSKHIGASTLEQKTGVKLNQKSYDSFSRVQKKLLDRSIDLAVAKLSEVNHLIETDELRVLATFTQNRVEELEGVPTLKEKGFDILYGSFIALVAPKETPDEVITYLHDKFKIAIESEQHIELVEKSKLPINYMKPEEVKNYMNAEEIKLKAYLKEVGIINK